MKKLLVSLTTLFCTTFTLAQVGPITEICLVTVDSTSTHNIVVWERAAQNSVNPIDSIKIYRTGVLTQDTLVGVVAWDSLSQFHDYSADPMLKFHRYRISGVDDQGVEGPMSLPHQTIHFTILEQGDSIRLNWTPYIGHALNFYDCWIDSAGSGPGFEWVNSTSNNIDTSWWDHDTPQDWTDLCYLVTTNWNHQCTSTKAQDHNSTRSNRATAASGGPSGLGEQKIIHDLSLFPNPAEESLNITFSSKNWTPIEVSLVDITGKTVIQQDKIKVFGQYNGNLSLEGLDTGMYFVVIKTSNQVVSRPVMKN